MFKIFALQGRHETTHGFYFMFSVIYLLILAVLLDIVLVTPAYAYIDPNTGGFFFQAVAPVVYGILGVIVVFWKRITGFIRGIVSRKKDPPDSSHDG